MAVKQKILIAVGIVIIVLLSAGIYVNYQMDRMVSSLSRPGILFTETDLVALTDDGESTVPDASGTNGNADNASSPGKTQSGISSSKNLNDNSQNHIVSGVQKKINRPIEKTDLIKAGIIILQNFSNDEISFLYRVGSKESFTNEEYKQVQKLMQSRLNDEDVATLKELGSKYGKELHILDGI